MHRRCGKSFTSANGPPIAGSGQPRSGPDRVLAEKASSARADRECLRQLQREVPNVFGDFELGRLDDGTEIATSPSVTEV